MKKFTLILSGFLFLQSFAFAQSEINVEETEITQGSSAAEEAHISIKEVKSLIASMAPSESCLDEYMKRRTQYIINLSLTPVYLTAAAVGGVYGGAAAGAGAAAIAGVDGWGGLGYIIVGSTAGAVLTVAYVTYDTTKSALGMIDNNLMMKALAEQYLNRPGPKTDKLYQKYMKTAKVPLTKEDFVTELMHLDSQGALCDGSMVKQPRFKIGFKLKYKVAKSKDLFDSMSS